MPMDQEFHGESEIEPLPDLSNGLGEFHDESLIDLTDLTISIGDSEADADLFSEVELEETAEAFFLRTAGISASGQLIKPANRRITESLPEELGWEIELLDSAITGDGVAGANLDLEPTPLGIKDSRRRATTLSIEEALIWAEGLFSRRCWDDPDLQTIIDLTGRNEDLELFRKRVEPLFTWAQIPRAPDIVDFSHNLWDFPSDVSEAELAEELISLLSLEQSLDPETVVSREYLRDVHRYGLITSERERELGTLAKAGDDEAVQELVCANLRFVMSVAKRYQNRGVPLIDLIQEGNVGLVTAARKFDPDQGVRFISYAVWWIRQGILAALANHGRSVRVPLNRASDLARIFRERVRLEGELGREPDRDELSAATELTPELIDFLESLNVAEVRLDDEDLDHEANRLVEYFLEDNAIDPTVFLEEATRSYYITIALGKINPRDAQVICLYFGLCYDLDEQTLEDIGASLKLTRERIRQIRNRGLDHLGGGPMGSALRETWLPS
jgi:RNA polymerase primary sigma factor